MGKKSLILIDGNSLIYRAYFAIRHLTNKNGIPTNATYGFVTMLNKIFREKKPDYIGVAFDVSKKTFRTDIYEEYKANRPPMPDDLVTQLPYIKEILKAKNIKIIEMENYEADDIVGTIAKDSVKKDVEVIIVSGDKDLYQLVNDRVFLFNPSQEILYDKEKVKEKIGVSPGQIVDFLALKGDSSDNIPGVPGIGEKTAKKLLNTYESIDNILSNINKIEKKGIQKKIENNQKTLEISRKLTQIKTDLPIEIKLKSFKYENPDKSELLKIYKELGFKTLIEEIVDNYDKEEDCCYETILSTQKLGSLIKKIRKHGEFAFDTETDKKNPVKAKLVGISFSFREGKASYLPIRHKNKEKQIDLEKAIQMLKPLFEDSKIKKTAHNVKYDLIVLRSEGIEVKGIAWDTMILSYLLYPNKRSHKLDNIVMEFFNHKMIDYKEIAGKGQSQKTLDLVSIEKVSHYSCEDSDYAYRLKNILLEKIKKQNLLDLYQKIELPLIFVLAHIEESGIKIDRFKLKQLSDYLTIEIEKIRNDIYEKSGEIFNINSTQQLGKILFEKLALPVIKKTKKTGAYSTSMDVLTELAGSYPIAKNILEYRKLNKLDSGYIRALPSLIYEKTGRIHTSYNQTIAATGRLSSSDPNLQNIPIRSSIGKKIRSAFIPEKGCVFLAADYSQIELRVLAHLSDDPVLIKSFIDGKDIHSMTAKEVFGDLDIPPDEKRARAKIINFAIIYGKTAYTLSKELGISNSLAQNFINRYFERYDKVNNFIDKSIKEAEEFGYVTTLLGRKRPVPEIKSSNRNIRSHGERIAINTKVQGSAADLMKKSMIDIYNSIKQKNLTTKIVLQVHDELVFEVPDKEKPVVEELVKQQMENVFKLKVPLIVDINYGNNWAETK